MAERCYRKMNSNPPVCGVHNVELRRTQVLIDSFAPSLGHVVCDLCPHSQAVVQEPKQQKERGAYLGRNEVPA